MIKINLAPLWDSWAKCFWKSLVKDKLGFETFTLVNTWNHINIGKEISLLAVCCICFNPLGH